MNTTENARPTLAIPVVLSGMANVFLGLSSLYWRELSDVSAITLVAYRVILSVVILSLLISLFRPLSQIKCITLKLIGLHCIASLLIAMNWATFIWSSINGYFFESGLGYLLAPCLSIALGAVLYRESMPVGKIMLTACALSTAVTLIIFMKSVSHLTYLTIATTWGFYTYIKKFTPLNAINGLFIETLFLISALIVAIVLFNLPIENPHELSARSNKLIWLAGVVSIIPLLMFSYTTGKIPLSLTGLLQFTLPLTLIAVALTFQ